MLYYNHHPCEFNKKSHQRNKGVPMKTSSNRAKLNDSFKKVTSRLKSGTKVSRKDVIMKTYAVADGYKANEVKKFENAGSGKMVRKAINDVANHMHIAKKFDNRSLFKPVTRGNYLVV